MARRQREVSNGKKTDAQVFIDMSWYKIGVHGLVFAWTGEEWVRSQRPADEVRRALEIEQFNADRGGGGSISGGRRA